jgi:hypothetical protein
MDAFGPSESKQPPIPEKVKKSMEQSKRQWKMTVIIVIWLSILNMLYHIHQVY